MGETSSRRNMAIGAALAANHMADKASEILTKKLPKPVDFAARAHQADVLIDQATTLNQIANSLIPKQPSDN